jgi:Tol biopolymer transport system component
VAGACTPPPAGDADRTLTNLTVGGNGESFDPSISDSGRYVVFTSEASNLVPGDTNGRADIFLKDRVVGTLFNLTQGANGDSLGGVISGDGSIVAFYSNASNLTADRDNGQFDVFTYKVSTGTISNRTRNGNGFSGYPSLSDNGQTLVYQSYATNLTTPGDTDGPGSPDIFRQVGSTITPVTGTGAFFDQPTVSGDGTVVAFQAYGAFGGTMNEPRVVTVGSTTSTPSTAGFYAGEPSLSDTGAVVAFLTFRRPNGVIQVGAADVSDPATVSGEPALTDDGTRVAYTSNDRVVLTTVGGASVTVAAGNGPSGQAAVSRDATRVAFYSAANNLGAPDPNAYGDVYVRDYSAG